MAEAAAILGLVSSVASLVDLSAKVVSRVREFTAKTSNVPESFHALSARLPLLTVTLQRITTQAQAGNLSHNLAEALQAVVDSTLAQVAVVHKCLFRVLPSEDASKLERAIKALKSLAKEDQICHAMEKIHENIDFLLLHQTTQHADTGDRILAELSRLTLTPPTAPLQSSGSSPGQVPPIDQDAISVQTDQMQQPPLTYRPRPSSTVPFRRDQDFIERDIFEQLWQRRNSKGQSVALAGLGGVGKSQIAIEYAYRIREEQPDTWLFWVHASSTTRVEEGFQKIAERTRAPGWDEPATHALDVASRWLENEANGEWVLIIDNLDDMELATGPWRGWGSQDSMSGTSDTRSLLDYLPQSTHGTIVITTRNREVALQVAQSVRDVVEVKPMDVATAVCLLQKKLSVPSSEEEMTSLVQSVDCMPLAITQAAAFISQRHPRMSVCGYVQELQRGDRERSALLERGVYDARRDRRSSNAIITTWHISFEHIRRSHRSATRLLALMSCFDREAIPEELLHHYGDEQVGEEDCYAKKEGDSFEDDVQVLRNYSLVGMNVDQATFEMHRLVQFSMRKWLEVHDKLDGWQDRYVIVMDEAFPTGDFENWRRCQVLYAHAEMVSLYTVKDVKCLIRWAALLYRAAWFARGQGWYEKAEKLLRTSAEAQTRALGNSHPGTLISMTGLASALWDQGKYQEAEDMHRQTLRLIEKVKGKEHPITLVSMNNLALALREQGKYDQAEKIHRQGLELWKKVKGETHPDTLTSMNNLVLLLREQGKYHEAEEIYRLTLEVREKVMGKEHPDTLTSMNNLALLLREQGKYHEAEEIHRLTLEVREKVMGKEHPDTLTSMNNLAFVLVSISQFEEASTLLQRALEGREKVLGKSHPDTIVCRYNYFFVLDKMKIGRKTS